MIPISIYHRSAKNAFNSLRAQWQILPASILLWYATQAIAIIATPLGVIGGFIAGFSQVLALSVFFSWLHDASPRKITFQSLCTFDYLTFSLVINATFFVWLITFTLATVTAGSPQLAWTGLALQVLLLVALNALPEMAYVAKVDGMHILQETFMFMQRHWIEWLLPMLILFIPILSLGNRLALSLISATNIMFPILPINVGISLLGFGIVGDLVAVVLIVWFMLFRKELFEQLVGRRM